MIPVLTRGQKLLAALVLLVVVLFVITVGTGGRQGEGDPGERPGGLVGALGDWFGGPAPAARTDLSADCLRPDGRLDIAARCTLRVAASPDGLREVELTATDAVTVSARAPRGDRQVETDVAAGDRIQVTVDGDGGDVVIRCTTSSTCSVTLGQEG